jgi:stage II sporulation protein D
MRQSPGRELLRSQIKLLVWISAIPISLVIVASLSMVVTSSRRAVPPDLQSFTRSSKTAGPAAVRGRPKTPEPLIRVNVTPGGEDKLSVEVRDKCRIVALENDRELLNDFRPGRLDVSSTKTGIKLGKHSFSTRSIELQPSESPDVRVGGHLYRGRLRLFLRTDGKISAVNVLPIEEYLASVVDSEMPAAFPEAAREAQAIVARTYALYQSKNADPNAVYDLLSSQRSQKYLGVEYTDAKGRRLAGESDSSRKAVKATRGLVCTWHGSLFCTYYSAVCGGRTANGTEFFKDAAEILRPVPCEWCRASPYFRWSTELNRSEFERRVAGTSRTAKPITAIRQIVEPGTGNVSKFEIDRDRKTESTSGIDLRDQMPAGTLYSPHFRIKLEKDQVKFDGRGHGHGVGFCQWGAKGQAEAGHDASKIVRHYYPGAELTQLGY